MPDALLSSLNNITHCSAICCVMNSCHVAGTLSLHSKFMLTLYHKEAVLPGSQGWYVTAMSPDPALRSIMLSPATAQPGLEPRTLHLCLDLLFLFSSAPREGLFGKQSSCGSVAASHLLYPQREAALFDIN